MKWSQVTGYALSAAIHAALVVFIVSFVLAQKPPESDPELMAIDLAMFQPPLELEPEPIPEPISELAPELTPDPEPSPPKPEPFKSEPKPEPKLKPKKVESPKPELKKAESPKPDRTAELQQPAALVAKQKVEQASIKQVAFKRWQAEQMRKQRETEQRTNQARQQAEQERIQAVARQRWKAEQARKQHEAEQAASQAKARAEQARQQAEARKRWEATQAAKAIQASKPSDATLGGESEVVNSNPLISSPRYRTPPTHPPYPRRAQEEGYEGTTIVEAQLDTSGNVSLVKVHQSSGHSMLDSAALGAVKSWKFEPARKNGQAIKSRVRVPVHFRLI